MLKKNEVIYYYVEIATGGRNEHNITVGVCVYCQPTNTSLGPVPPPSRLVELVHNMT